MIEGKKLLIFDLGGVLIDLHIDRSFAALVELGIPPSILTERNCLINNYMMQFDRGDISRDDMFAYMASQLPACSREMLGAGITERMQEIWNMMLGDYAPYKFHRIQELRSRGYRVVMLSNTNDGHWDELERKFAQTVGKPLHDFFDAFYLSYRMHSRKPEQEIFTQLLAAEGVSPGDSLFFDDSAENCDAARAVGMGAVLMERNAAWGKELMED
ncbi:MAG: HAD family phosphatase [Bacteroidaceae bacterium]|nr:HAD family phosphatase [Bacteroidaceae bacterium]